ncbi:hypothetical protein [Enterococcus lactis]
MNISNIKSIEKKEDSILFDNLESLYIGKKGIKKLLIFLNDRA